MDGRWCAGGGNAADKRYVGKLVGEDAAVTNLLLMGGDLFGHRTNWFECLRLSELIDIGVKEWGRNEGC